MGDHDARLFERDGELAQLDALIADGLSGRGGVAIVEGTAGIGKTALLEAARRRATSAGMLVLAAAGSELERDFAFGVVRQLFEPLLVDRERARSLLEGPARLAAAVVGRSAQAASEPAGALHGLYWLAVDLSAQQPLLIVIDDAHWADAPSLRYAVHLARRIEGLPILLVLATRRDEPSHEHAWLGVLTQTPGAEVLHPSPLSLEAIEVIIRERWPAADTEEFSVAAQAATGGLPFFVTELIEQIDAERLVPSPMLGQRVDSLVSRATAHATSTRIERLGGECTAVARGVAVLGRFASVGRIAELFALPVSDVLTALDRLAGAGVVELAEPIRFAHPILRSAVHGSLARSERAAAHKRAARVLAADGTEREVVAGHLVLADPEDDPHVVELLRAAAGDALHRGGVESARTFLERAAAESRDPTPRSELLHELGKVKLLMADPSALGDLREALRLTSGPVERARIAADMAQQLAWAAEWDELRELLDTAIEESGGDDLELVARLEGYRAAVLAYDGRGAVQFMRRRTELRDLAQAVGGPAGDTISLLLASMSTSRGDPPGASADVAERVLRSGDYVRHVGGEHWSLTQGIWSLLADERLDAAHAVAEEMVQNGRLRGSAMVFALGTCHRGWVACRRGDLATAEADLRAVIDVIEQEHLAFLLPSIFWFYVDALVERVELDDVANLARSFVVPPQLAGSASEGLVLETRAQLMLEQDHSAGVADLRAAGELYAASGLIGVGWSSWRSALALALSSEDAEARELVAENLRLAQASGVQRAIGVAQRAAGLLDGDTAALEESVAALEASPARLELARSLRALGAVLGRHNQRTDAQTALRRALDLALQCGAQRLALRVEEDLRVSGARPRRRHLSGIESLTPAESRVARMAATGMTNRQIAQSLFLTPKTVENQLRSVYAKLGLTGRDELAKTLTSPPPSES